MRIFRITCNICRVILWHEERQKPIVRKRVPLRLCKANASVPVLYRCGTKLGLHNP